MSFIIKKLCLVEYALRDFGGHYFNYVNSIYQAARYQSLEVEVYGNKNASEQIIDAIPIEPTFEELIYRNKMNRFSKFFIDPVLANFHFYKDLCAISSRLNLQNNCIFSVTVDHSNLIGWVFWINKFRENFSPVLILMLRFSYYDVNKNKWKPSVFWLRFGLWFLSRSKNCQNVLLTVDSSNLAEQYRRLTSLKVDVLPIPHTHAHISKAHYKNINIGPIKFVSLGELRLAKGFAIIANAIQILRDNNQLDGLEFVLQCYRGEHDRTGDISLNLLKELNLSCVKLIESTLNNKEYLDLLESSSVILIPYSRDIYFANTSGTFTEAMSMGKPVIVTDDTWMSNQLKDTGAGVTAKDQDASDLARAILEMRDNYTSILAKARLNCSNWNSYHNSISFVEEIKLISGNVTGQNFTDRRCERQSQA